VSMVILLQVYIAYGKSTMGMVYSFGYVCLRWHLLLQGSLGSSLWLRESEWIQTCTF